MNNATMRSFIALSLPLSAINRVAELQDQLRRQSREPAHGLTVGWVRPANMHVTLKFLDQIPEEVAWALQDMMRVRLAGHRPFVLQVRGVSAFPDTENPRVLWVGLHQGEGAPLSALVEDLEAGAEELGFARETRPFAPHLTLGRVKSGRAAGLLEGQEQRDLGACSISQVVLYRSDLQRQGAEYIPVCRFSLEG